MALSFVLVCWQQGSLWCGCYAVVAAFFWRLARTRATTASIRARSSRKGGGLWPRIVRTKAGCASTTVWRHACIAMREDSPALVQVRQGDNIEVAGHGVGLRQHVLDQLAQVGCYSCGATAQGFGKLRHHDGWAGDGQAFSERAGGELRGLLNVIIAGGCRRYGAGF